MFIRGPVSLYLKKQFTVILLSIKVEYIALILASKEAMWLYLLLSKLKLL